MPQVSRPLLIALVAVVGFAGVWMTVLRKHASDTAAAPPPKAPGMTGLGNAIDKAHGAVAASKASAATAEAAAGQTTANPAPAKPVAAKPAKPVAAKPAKPVAVKPAPRPNVVRVPTGTTTVLLFAGAGADDAFARQVVRSIRAPHVRTIVASLGQVSRYAPMLGGLQVTGAPSIFVIGPQRTARQIVGLPDRDQVEAAVESVSSTVR